MYTLEREKYLAVNTYKLSQVVINIKQNDFVSDTLQCFRRENSFLIDHFP